MLRIGEHSAMNTVETIGMLIDKRADGEHKIPRIIYADAFFSEMVAFADLVLPDTTYLERGDCISLLDRSISTAEGSADAIRRPMLKPDRGVASAALTCEAALIATAGVLVERWLLFAEATHTAVLHYRGGASAAPPLR